MLRLRTHYLFLSVLCLTLSGCGGRPTATPPPPRDANYDGPAISVTVETRNLDPDSPAEEFAILTATAPSSHHAIIVDRIDRDAPNMTVYLTIETPRPEDTVSNTPLDLRHELRLGFVDRYTNIDVYARTSMRPPDPEGEHSGTYGPAVTYP